MKKDCVRREIVKQNHFIEKKMSLWVQVILFEGALITQHVLRVYKNLHKYPIITHYI